MNIQCEDESVAIKDGLQMSPPPPPQMNILCEDENVAGAWKQNAGKRIPGVEIPAYIVLSKPLSCCDMCCCLLYFELLMVVPCAALQCTQLCCSVC